MDLVVGERDGYVNFFERKDDGTLANAIRIQANNTDIKVTNNSSPVITDWNNDGLLDLLVDSDVQDDGVRLYINSGSSENYKYTDYSKLKYGNVDIAFKRSQIRVFDLNGDNKKDLLLGTGLTAQSRIYYFENIGTAENPILKFPTQLKTKSGKPIYPPFTQYDIVFDIEDWNGDGSPDIVMGDYDALGIHLFLSDKETSLKSVSENSEKAFSMFHQVGKSQIAFSISKKGDYFISINNLKGQTIFSKQINLEKGINTIELSDYHFSSSLYIVNIKEGAETYSKKILIK